MPNSEFCGSRMASLLGKNVEKMAPASHTRTLLLGARSGLNDGYESPKPIDSGSSAYMDALLSICDAVRENAQYSENLGCEDFMDPYEFNEEQYQYDADNTNYTSQFLDQPNCPSTPEDVEAQFQTILMPYGIQYVRPQLKYVPAYEQNDIYNGEEARNWTKREPNLNLIEDMSNYIVDNFIYDEKIPLTTYPNTNMTMYLDASRLPNLDITTHEFKHLVELPVLQNLLYIYALNEFRKVDWAIRVVRGKEHCKSALKDKLEKWLDKNGSNLNIWLNANQKKLDFMENEMTLGQHCFNNIPLIKQIYDYYLPEILGQ